MADLEAPQEPLGALAVRWARRALVVSVQGGAGRDPVRAMGGEPVAAALKVPRGVFVTLETYPKARLRGCIGFPMPVYPLHLAIPRAAAAAALEDPRFPPVKSAELDHLTVEVSVLTVPERIEGPAADRVNHIVVGRDGLIIDSGDRSGLLLPQVAPEQGWDALEFLEGVCEKADLPKTAWKSDSTQLRRFQAEIYRELAPGGRPVPSPSGHPP